ncbi:MAG: redox-regulated ATPase YchF [Candidatus Aenigmarchaeota archaeon]|nr:redox-regulated ATPase YchF [Candidatus Aenigmarchaeota archaeon]
MQIGVVGKPSVGKSTFFKALTLANVAIAAYPFTTIEPNKATAFVRVQCVDKELGVQCSPRFGYCVNGTRFVPVEMLDVAGLVPGAHEGKGMGNQFLDDLRQANALIHVVDIAGATNEKGEAVEPGTYDPAFDVKFLEFEIDMWFLSVIKKGWDKLARQMQQEKQDPTKVLAKQLSGLNVSEELVQKAVTDAKVDPQQPAYWPEEGLHQIARYLRKATKPMVIVANKIDLPHGAENFERLKKQFPDYTFIAASAESELALREASKSGLIDYVPGNSTFSLKGQLTDKQSKALEFIKKNILEKFSTTGVQQALDTAVFQLLEFIAIFPGGVNKLADQHGNVLPDCFLLKPASTALDFAYKLHTDLGKHFIRAIDVKTKRAVGKDYLLKHRDVIEIVSGK